MRRWIIGLGLALAVLLVASQLVIPRIVENQIKDELTKHGGTASVHLKAFPAIALLISRLGDLRIDSKRLRVDFTPEQKDAFKQLDRFSSVDIEVKDSRAGPLSVQDFKIHKTGSHQYEVALKGSGTAADVATYAGSQFGSIGSALAGFAASALGNAPIPVDATMRIDTSSGHPMASNVQGDVAGFPAGPLVQIAANSLLAGI